VRGQVAVDFPQQRECVILEAGDAVLVPAGEPHRIYNGGSETAEMVWATAPSLGREQFLDTDD
jgi:mannose-6-phosphate isomerase-like protein (cupin superfamily)